MGGWPPRRSMGGWAAWAWGAFNPSSAVMRSRADRQAIACRRPAVDCHSLRKAERGGRRNVENIKFLGLAKDGIDALAHRRPGKVQERYRAPVMGYSWCFGAKINACRLVSGRQVGSVVQSRGRKAQWRTMKARMVA